MSGNKNRKRSPNFSKDQLKILVDEYTKNKEILDSSRINEITNKRKNEIWLNITKLINSIDPIGLKRSNDEVKRKLITFKSSTKVKLANMKNYEKKTGGGPPLEQNLNEVEQVMLTTISDQLISGIRGGMDSEMTESLNESFNTGSDENLEIINSDTFDDSNEEKAALKKYSSVKRFNVKNRTKISNSKSQSSTYLYNYRLNVLQIETSQCTQCDRIPPKGFDDLEKHVHFSTIHS